MTFICAKYIFDMSNVHEVSA